MKPERKLWLDLKKNTPTICWNRIENLAVPGLPDVLGYNKHQHFFTVELKVTKSNKIRFSPHQIAFHVKHPKNSFILVEHLGQRSVKLFPGSMIKELDACGLALDPLCLTLDACCLLLIFFFRNFQLPHHSNQGSAGAGATSERCTLKCLCSLIPGPCTI